jgi:hypothetical protein
LSITINVNTTPVTLSVPTIAIPVTIATANVNVDIDHGIWVDIGSSSIEYIDLYGIRGAKNVPVLATGTVVTFTPAYTDTNYMKSYFYCTRTDDDGNVIEIPCSFTIINSSSFRVVPSNDGTLDWQTTYLGNT